MKELLRYLKWQENHTQNGCVMSTKMFTQYLWNINKLFNSIKMFSLKIVNVTFLIIFELLFSQRFEIHDCNTAKKISSNISKKYIYIKIEKYPLILKLLAW